VSYYPVALDLRDKRCVVLGGGKIAAGKLPLLTGAQAEVTVIAVEAEVEIQRASQAGMIRWLQRSYREGDLAGARLVIDASDDPVVNQKVRRESDRVGALLNVVDRTALCDWIAPAVVDRGPLKVAITTSGESPFLAAALRRRLETVIGKEWGPFTGLVGEIRRRLRAEGMSLGEQERIYRRLLRSETRDLLRDGLEGPAQALADRLLSSPISGRVTIAGAGPGAVEHLTGAVGEALYEADVVFHDALIEKEVLRRCGPNTRLVDVGKRGGGRRAVQAEINRLLIEAAGEGRDVVRLKGGDPFVFGRGGEELAALVEAGVEARVLPGLSAATAGPTLAGIPLTLRGVASSVGFATAQLEEGPARLQELARAVDTLVVMMALRRSADVARDLAPVLGRDRPVALVANASTARQQVLVSTLGRLAVDLAAADLEPPAMLVVGEVVSASFLARPSSKSAGGSRSASS
jgi:uroporphyrin-III C-methyltransferase / precorrin-2 dehydrogenase / sirohydrochlorin ferrochelatase